jgi:hypothetical protein
MLVFAIRGRWEALRSFDIPESDTDFRGEPETVDVWDQQGEVDWSKEPLSDDNLSDKVKGFLNVLKGE